MIIYNVNSDNGKVLSHLCSRIWIENRESHSLRLTNVEEEVRDVFECRLLKGRVVMILVNCEQEFNYYLKGSHSPKCNYVTFSFFFLRECNILIIEFSFHSFVEGSIYLIFFGIKGKTLNLLGFSIFVYVTWCPNIHTSLLALPAINRPHLNLYL